ncbi:MAG TPA: hypothetical protein VM677_27865 [Actinokineospora sp.]|nr:hypothetical protein [Actinokineospora sp.]
MSAPKPLRVTVAFTVTLADPSDWAGTFGAKTRAEITNDVRRYIIGDIGDYGVFGSGEVDARVEHRYKDF